VNFKRRISAVKVPHNKNTAAMESVRIAAPAEVVLPLKLNARATANEPVVAVGDHVYVGQLIAKEAGKNTVDIHATVSGTVASVDEKCIITGGSSPAIRIVSDGKMEKDPAITVPALNSLEDFLTGLRKSAIVGLGGAAFPLWGKLDAIRRNPIKTVLINGAECEPYITADHRTMLECKDDIRKGVDLMREYLKSERFVIGIEENKPDAIALMQETFADCPDVEVKPLKSVYPQGAKQVFMYNSTGLVVEKGQRTTSLGVTLMNITTLAKMGRYFTDGMPMVERSITVDGGAVEKPMNVIIPIGTKVGYVLEACGVKKEELGKLIFGGPMMGKTVDTLEAPITKATNAVLAFDVKQAVTPEAVPCIHCGRCVEHCPLDLNPTAFAKAMDDEDEAARYTVLTREQVNICMECGCCSYICPAHRPLAETNAAAKNWLRKYEAQLKAAAEAKEGGK